MAEALLEVLKVGGWTGEPQGDPLLHKAKDVDLLLCWCVEVLNCSLVGMLMMCCHELVWLGAVEQ